MYRSAALNLQGSFTMLYCCLQILTLVPLYRPVVNKVPFVTDKHLKFKFFRPEHQLHFLLHASLLFSCIGMLLGLVSTSEDLLISHGFSTKTTSEQTSPDYRWMYLWNMLCVMASFRVEHVTCPHVLASAPSTSDPL